MSQRAKNLIRSLTKDACPKIQGVVEWSDEALFRHYHPRLVRFAARVLLGTTVDPEDVAQESLWKAISNRDQYDAKYRFSTWIYAIAHRTALDHRRKERYYESNENLAGVADPHPSGIDLTDHQDCSENIWRVAEEVLSSVQYSVLWLRFAEEMSIREIASVLGKTCVTIRVNLHRARSKMQLHLAGETP